MAALDNALKQWQEAKRREADAERQVSRYQLEVNAAKQADKKDSSAKTEKALNGAYRNVRAARKELKAAELELADTDRALVAAHTAALQGNVREVREHKKGAQVVLLVNGKSYTRHLQRGKDGHLRGFMATDAGSKERIVVVYDLKALQKKTEAGEVVVEPTAEQLEAALEVAA